MGDRDQFIQNLSNFIEESENDLRNILQKLNWSENELTKISKSDDGGKCKILKHEDVKTIDDPNKDDVIEILHTKYNRDERLRRYQEAILNNKCPKVPEGIKLP